MNYDFPEDAKVLYRVTVPEARNKALRFADLADEYVVIDLPPENGGCAILGRYGDRWHWNVSGRWLVRHLLDQQLPKELTAENGAKGALMGEFTEDGITTTCPYCVDYDEDDCAECGGSGEYTTTVHVTWTTIKKIWRAAVAHFGAKTTPKDQG